MQQATSAPGILRRYLAAIRAHKARSATILAMATVLGATIVACGGGGGGAGGSDSSGGQTTPPPPPPVNGPAWLNVGGDPQHTATAAIATQTLNRILWQTPLDTAPQYSPSGYLLIHYGSPAITAKNTVLLPVKRAAALQYRVEARAGATGTLVWSFDSDYVMPPHRWVPSYNVTLTRSNRVYAAGSGGKVYYRDNADSASSTTQTAVFYGAAVYTQSQAALDASVFINTPITADAAGNIYFGFIANPGNPANLASGVARIGADGTTTWAGATARSGDSTVTKAATNSAPALSSDGKTLYVAVDGDSTGNTNNGYTGYLLALDSSTLALKSKVALIDPVSAKPATVSDDGTASPMVGPDGDVYLGVLETYVPDHNDRGWLMHFDATLSQTKTPGSFGWDDTPSVVPASMVSSYKGSSSYLLMVKYNNYGGAGSGDSKNRVAVLDPNATQNDAISGNLVMKEVVSILGQTPDPDFPGGVTEWCINTAAVDPLTHSIIVNNEDGYMYRWDVSTNTLSEKLRLTSGLGESYTPTAVGPDGAVYGINNGVLFAIGK